MTARAGNLLCGFHAHKNHFLVLRPPDLFQDALMHTQTNASCDIIGLTNCGVAQAAGKNLSALICSQVAALHKENQVFRRLAQCTAARIYKKSKMRSDLCATHNGRGAIALGLARLVARIATPSAACPFTARRDERLWFFALFGMQMCRVQPKESFYPLIWGKCLIQLYSQISSSQIDDNTI